MRDKPLSARKDVEKAAAASQSLTLCSHRAQHRHASTVARRGFPASFAAGLQDTGIVLAAASVWSCKEILPPIQVAARRLSSAKFSESARARHL